MYFDAHTHLNEDRLFADRQKHVQDFLNAGGKGLINVGVDADWNQRAVQIAQLSKEKWGDQIFIKATIGIHPSEASFGKIASSQNIEQAMEGLRKIYEDHPDEIVAIGECGMDAHYPDYDKVKEIQQELFHAQCSLARELGLPVVIHSRDQFADTLEVIKNYTDLKIYFHCRGYGPEELEILHHLLPNFRFGCCGNITYPAAEQLRASLKKGVELGLQSHAHDHKIQYLLETDAPYLTPQKNRGKLNTPVQVVDTYEYVAAILSKPSEIVQDEATKAFFGLFGK